MQSSQRAIAMTLLAWAALYLLITGIRTAAPAFIYGLAMLNPFIEEEPDADPATELDYGWKSARFDDYQ